MKASCLGISRCRRSTEKWHAIPEARSLFIRRGQSLRAFWSFCLYLMIKLWIIIVRNEHNIFNYLEIVLFPVWSFLNAQSQIQSPFWNIISMQLNLLHTTSVPLYLADDPLLIFICKFLRSFIDSAWNYNSDTEMKMVGKYKEPECCITVCRAF